MMVTTTVKTVKAAAEERAPTRPRRKLTRCRRLRSIETTRGRDDPHRLERVKSDGLWNIAVDDAMFPRGNLIFM